MANVMSKAWEIARAGQKKFGGSVKDYFAEALRSAWAIIKKGVSVVANFGYQEIKKLNGVLHFVVDNIDGLEVTFLTTEKNFYNGKTYTKKNPLNYKSAIHKETGNEVRLYNIAIHAGDVEMKLGDDEVVIKNSYDKSQWQTSKRF